MPNGPKHRVDVGMPRVGSPSVDVRMIQPTVAMRGHLSDSKTICRCVWIDDTGEILHVLESLTIGQGILSDSKVWLGVCINPTSTRLRIAYIALHDRVSIIPAGQRAFKGRCRL